MKLPLDEFNGKKVLITGGTKGLGYATAELFISRGAEVFLAYRSDKANAEKAQSELQKKGKAHLIACDLSEENGANKLFDQFEEKTSALDIYIHNAAATAFKPLLEIKAHHVDKTFNISVKAFIGAVQRATPLMKNGGSIVSVSGMDTLKMVMGHGLLAGAKASLEMLTKYFAHELAPKKIHVNAVNPGFLETNSTRKFLGAAFDRANHYFTHASPLKRAPTLEEIAKVILFLCSEQSSWVVGQVLNVDGGQDFSLPSIQTSH